MSDFFKGIDPVPFKGPDSDDPMAFRFYEPDRMVLGKRMEDQLRMAIAYWHAFAWPGGEPFGGQTFLRPWLWSARSSAHRLRLIPVLASGSGGNGIGLLRTILSSVSSVGVPPSRSSSTRAANRVLPTPSPVKPLA